MEDEEYREFSKNLLTGTISAIAITLVVGVVLFVKDAKQTKEVVSAFESGRTLLCEDTNGEKLVISKNRVICDPANNRFIFINKLKAKTVGMDRCKVMPKISIK